MAIIIVDKDRDTFEDWRRKTNDISGVIGDIDRLQSDKPSIIRAVNDNINAIGVVALLDTTVKDNLTNAINEINTNLSSLTINVGDLPDLDTTDQSSIVNSINEVNSFIGDLSTLTTIYKADFVGAINEIDANADTNTTSIGVLANLDTTLKTDLVVAINEAFGVAGGVGDLGALTTDAQGSAVAAINEVDGHADANLTNIGNMALDTTATADLTVAVNEVHNRSLGIGDIATLVTEDKSSTVAAINEMSTIVDSKTGAVGDPALLDTGVKTDLVSAINEVNSNTVAMALILG